MIYSQSSNFYRTIEGAATHTKRAAQRLHKATYSYLFVDLQPWKRKEKLMNEQNEWPKATFATSDRQRGEFRSSGNKRWHMQENEHASEAHLLVKKRALFEWIPTHCNGVQKISLTLFLAYPVSTILPNISPLTTRSHTSYSTSLYMLDLHGTVTISPSTLVLTLQCRFTLFFKIVVKLMCWLCQIVGWCQPFLRSFHWAHWYQLKHLKITIKGRKFYHYHNCGGAIPKRSITS